MKLKKSLVLMLATFFCTAVALTPLLVSAQTLKGKPIKLGVTAPLSGKGADWGLKGRIDMTLAQEDVNTSGGINGSPLELIWMDTRGDPKEMPIIMSKLILEDKVAAVMGPWASAECETGMPVAKRLECPSIGPTSAKPGLLKGLQPWCFRNSLTDDKMFAGSLAGFRRQYPNVKKFGWVVDVKEAWAKSLGEDVMPPALKAAGYLIVNENDCITIEVGQQDMSAAVTRLKALKVDAVALGASYPEASTFAIEMKRQGVKIPAMGGVALFAPPLIAMAGADAVEGWVVCATGYLDPADPKKADFLKRFIEGAKKATPHSPFPGYADPNLYDTVMITAEILRKAKVTGDTPLKEMKAIIRDGWQNLRDYPGMAGLTSIDPKTGDGIKQVFTLVVRNGRFVEVK